MSKIRTRKLGEKIQETIQISKSELKQIDLVVKKLKKAKYTKQTIQGKYKTPLIILRDKLKTDFLKANKEDIMKLNEWISSSDYSKSRKRQLRTAIRFAYLVWFKMIDADEDLEIIKPIRILKLERINNKNIKSYKIKLDKLIKTNQELKEKILDNLRDDRDKFYFALRFESGGRCCEMESLKWDNLFEADEIMKVRIITAKNSGDEPEREIPLINCLPYLNRWKRQYIEVFGSDLKGKYIFRKKTDKKNEPIGHGYYSKICRGLKEVSNIEDLCPKYFRKYAISRWQRENIPEALIKKMSGHSKNSKAISHYSYHEQEDVDNAVMKMNGIKKKGAVKENHEPIKCSKCFNYNVANTEECEVCSFPLNQKGLLSYEDKTKSIAKQLIETNKNFKQELIQQLKEEIKAELRKEILQTIKA